MIDFILRPFRRNFGKDKKYYRAVDDMFGFIAHNIELYKLALIHKSASVVLADGTHINNERLEFLGDAVLESVSSEYLFIEFPDKNEGFLTQLRSKMVSRQMLNEVAKRIGLDDYVITHSSNNLSQKHIYGDAFEAMVGAIYLDQGYDFVNRLLINHIFVDYIKVDNLLVSETDFKSRLIEWCQKNHHTIQYQTANDKSYSSSHPFFYSKVLIDGIEVGYGAGDSKKEAEQRASYSVSHGFSEADYTKMMDKLDSLDGETKQRERREKGSEPKLVTAKPEQKAVKDAKPEPKVVKEVKAEPMPEPKTETASEPKPRSRRTPKPKVKPAENVVAEPIKEATVASVEPKKKVNKKPVKEKTSAEEKKLAEEESTVAEMKPAEQKKPAAEKSAKPRRRRAVKSVKDEEVAAIGAEGDNGQNKSIA